MIFNLTTSNARLFIQIFLIFIVNEVNDGLPAREGEGERGGGRGLVKLGEKGSI